MAGNRIYVTDAKGVAIFSADGSLKGRIDKAAGVAFAYPNGVAVGPSGTLVISDTNNGRVVSLDYHGTLVWTAGPSDSSRRTVGLPRGLSVSENGSTLIADAFLFRVQRISDQGVVMEGYGERGPRLGGFEFPNDADVRGDLVIVADKENNRVQIILWPGLSGTVTK